jgi:hypothetical protein
MSMAKTLLKRCTQFMSAWGRSRSTVPRGRRGTIRRITTIEAQALVRGLGGLNLIGGHVVEVAPPFDQTCNNALVGVTLMFEILCLLAAAVRAAS